MVCINDKHEWQAIIMAFMTQPLSLHVLQDRFAEFRSRPPIDTIGQDWFLTNSEEAGGFTVLEFSRNFTSCDPQDLDITVCMQLGSEVLHGC